MSSLTKALRPELLRTYTDAMKAYYDRAHREQDMFKQDLSLNMAIFKSSETAKQETNKIYQKDWYNKVSTRDSHEVVLFQESSKTLNINIKESKYSNKKICSRDWVSDYTKKTPIDRKLEILEILKKVSKASSLTKLCICWYMYKLSKPSNTSYINSLSLAQRLFWNKEIELIENILKDQEELKKSDLWEKTNYPERAVTNTIKFIKRRLSCLLER